MQRAISTFVFSLAAAWLSIGSAQAALPEVVTERMLKLNQAPDAMGALVIRLHDGAQLVSHNATRGMLPASNMKILTAIAGLQQLGPIFRTRTELLTNGVVDGKTLQGDLILRGGGDLDFTWQVFQELLQTLRLKGIHVITGDLIVDRSLYQPARIDIDVPSFDESPDSSDNVIPDAVFVNQNMLKLELDADTNKLHVGMSPALDNVSIKNAMQLSDSACASWSRGWKTPTVEQRSFGKIVITLHGSFPKNCHKTPSVNVLERNEFTLRLFRALWQQQGGHFRGKLREDSAPANAVLLAQHQSRSLAEQVRDTMKSSDNVLARQIYLNLGSYTVDHPMSGKVARLPSTPELLSTSQRAEQQIRAWLLTQGIDPTGIVLENGSGLSRIEQISPTQLAAILLVGHQSIWAPEFKSSMPLAGMDGTLRNRMKGGPATGYARMKTGTLRNAVGLSGYVQDTKGNTYIVASMFNAEVMNTSEVRGTLDLLAEWVASQ